MKHHKALIKNSAEEFDDLVLKWDKLHVKDNPPTENEIDVFIDRAANFDFEMSSDY